VKLDDREKIYERIERSRGRPLIVYATSTRPGAETLIAGDVVREFIDQIEAVDTKHREVDVLIHSYGGDALTAWRLMSVLRERFEKVSVLVPFAAFSAATIFALGADEIVMHPHACLGPIDPQITVHSPDGKGRQFAYEDLTAFLGFLNEEIGITEQAQLAVIADRLFQALDPLVVGAAQRASDLASEVGARMLQLHMKDERRCEQIAQNLNKSFFAHGDAVSRTRALGLELRVAETNVPLERLMWKAYLGLEELMSLRDAFDPAALVLADPAVAAQLEQPAPLQMPPNTPAPVMNQLITQVAQAAAQKALNGSAAEVKFTIVRAVIESVRASSEFRQSGGLSAHRQADGNIRVSTSVRESGWHRRAEQPSESAGKSLDGSPPHVTNLTNDPQVLD
jgi:hypothetical protein